jgi:hypothetical protein
MGAASLYSEEHGTKAGFSKAKQKASKEGTWALVAHRRQRRASRGVVLPLLHVQW